MASHGEPGTGKDLLITNARIIDGRGVPPDGRLRSIRVEDGRIAGIWEDPAGREVAVADAPTTASMRILDVRGATVMPGLIDAHTHMASVPGSMYRKDNQEELARLRLRQLRARVACGITSVLDCSISAPMLRWYRDHALSGGVGPSVFALAPTFYTPGGYCDDPDAVPYMMSETMRPVSTRADVVAGFAAYEDLSDRVVGAKVLLETGGGMLPVHSPEMRNIIAEECAERRMPIYVHAYRKNEQAMALDMGVRTLVHSGFMYGSPSRAFIDRMQKQGVYQVTTVSFLRELSRPDSVDDALEQLTVPSEELATVVDPGAWVHMYSTMSRAFLPKWVPTFVAAGYTAFTGTKTFRGFLERSVRNAGKAIMRMHEAGIPIVVGTDSGNWPLIPSCFHGPSMIREIELLGEVGMAPMDLICSATRIPAQMMGIDQLVGTVEVGKRADLVVVGEDPLTDLGAFRRSIRYTVCGGEARTPEQWMRDASASAFQIRRKSPLSGEGTWQTVQTSQTEEACSSPTPGF
jgi:imidazolonepropionase-like amidohydrolase